MANEETFPRVSSGTRGFLERMSAEGAPCCGRREPVEKLRFSAFHALPAGSLSFAGPKESNQRKGPWSLIRCTPRLRIRSNRLRSRIQSFASLRPGFDRAAPLDWSASRPLEALSLGLAEAGDFFGRTSAKGASCCERRAKIHFSPRHFRWFFMQREERASREAALLKLPCPPGGVTFFCWPKRK